jgi:hypothetical protein
MTSRDLLMAMFRRWYVTLAGNLCTLAALVVFALHPGGVYYTQFQVDLLPPQEPGNPNTLQSAPYDMTALAGLVVLVYNHGVKPQRTSLSTTTLYGEGFRQASRVQLRNDGTQWATFFDVPVIDVQVVDGSEAAVGEKSRRIVERLQQILRDRQAAMRISPASTVTLRPAPTEPLIYFVQGSRIRAAGAIALIGACLTLVAVGLVDRWLSRRRLRQPPPAEEQQPAPVPEPAGRV